MRSIVLFLVSILFATALQAEERDVSARRVPWTTSRVTGSPDPPPPFHVTPTFESLRFNNPVEMERLPDSNRLLMVELGGKIYSFPDDPDCEKADLFIDLKKQHPKFRRAYGVAFHPRFSENRLCYLSYVLEDKDPAGSRVSQFRVTDEDPPRCDPDSEKVILTWLSGGHNGACLRFGPDGYLYISTGDGSGPNPPDTRNTGQDVSDLLSSILRIDVGGAAESPPYRIPADNPFLDTTGARGEVWAYGFRNPWKMAFDPRTGELWTGDVGWELWEMVYQVERGGNYGWSLVEGSQPVRPQTAPGPTPVLPPAAEHSHTEARSVTGGFVYRGEEFPELDGKYVYGDYVTGKIWSVRQNDEGDFDVRHLADTQLPIITFGLDGSNELLVVAYTGEIYRLSRNSSSQANRQFPTRLSETGLFDSTADHRPAAGVLSYQVAAEPWMDGADSQRLLALPGESAITNGKTWTFPQDAVLAKTISFGDRRLETQLLHFDGAAWRGYTYVWNEEQTDADLADADGKDAIITIDDPSDGKRQQAWRFFSRDECLLCHNPRAGSALSFNAAHLAGELSRLTAAGAFDREAKAPQRTLVDPYDESAELSNRARSYLHVNCAHCHRRGGGGTAPFELRHELRLERTFIVDQRPSQGGFGVDRARVLAPGDACRSMIWRRMAKLGRGRMPHLGSQETDEPGLRLIARWIESLPEKDRGPHPPAASSDEQWQALLSCDQEKRADLVRRMLRTSEGAARLRLAINEGALDEPIRNQIVAVGAAHDDPLVRDLFEPLTPYSQRAKRLGGSVNPSHILALHGDAARGAEMFFRSKTLQCRNCHQVADQGKSVGPDLTRIGAERTPSQLLESLLDPSRRVEAKWAAHTIQTVDGRVVTGLLRSREDDRVTLQEAQGKVISVANSQIETMDVQSKSLMPDQLLRDMTAQQAADLLAFLSSLKGKHVKSE